MTVESAAAEFLEACDEIDHDAHGLAGGMGRYLAARYDLVTELAESATAVTPNA